MVKEKEMEAKVKEVKDQEAERKELFEAFKEEMEASIKEDTRLKETEIEQWTDKEVRSRIKKRRDIKSLSKELSMVKFVEQAP